jgi:hypothetical protein
MSKKDIRGVGWLTSRDAGPKLAADLTSSERRGYAMRAAVRVTFRLDAVLAY